MSEEKKSLQLSRHGISGIILIPLLTWFLVSFFYIINDPSEYLPVFFYSPINAIFGILFSVTALYHLDYDLKYVIEHSKRSELSKNLWGLFFDFVSVVMAMATVLSILQLHFMGFLVA